MKKMNDFCLVISQYVPFKEIINYLTSLKKDLRFKYINELIKVVFSDKTKEEEMSLNASET